MSIKRIYHSGNSARKMRNNFFPSLQVVGRDLSDPIRSHKDLAKNAAPHYQDAVKYYENLSKQLVNQGHIFDLFACSLDQVCIYVLFLDRY